MTEAELSEYLAGIKGTFPHEVFIPRRLTTREAWDRAGDYDYARLVGILREYDPDLTRVLENPRLVFVGEPGIGKTWLAEACMVHFAKTGIAPVLIPLVEYQGSLGDLLRLHGGDLFRDDANFSGNSLKRAHVLDGLDEVPGSMTARFLDELTELCANDPDSRIVLTCRQAVYAPLRKNVPPSFSEYYPLGFDTDDVLDYAVARGLDLESFRRELDRTDMWMEASVPFVLSKLVDVFATHERLEVTRSANMSLVVDDLLTKRTRFGVSTQRDALQWLALGMEIYGRNELSLVEAGALLAKHVVATLDEAKLLLTELTQTILLTTQTGVRFQLRSLGEFLAATLLKNTAVPQVLSYVRLRGSHVLNPTWQNATSYLMEMNRRVCAYFVREAPEWTLSASKTVFSIEQRRELVRRIAEKLGSQSEWLLDSPYDHHRVGRLLDESCAEWLLPQLSDPDRSRRANALLLLGHLQHPTALAEARTIAPDRSADSRLRQTAFVVIILNRYEAFMFELLDTYSPDDPLGRAPIDFVADLITPASFARALPELLRQNNSPVHISIRLGSIRSRDMLDSVLNYFLANPRAITDREVAECVKPVWRLLYRYADSEILTKIGQVLANCERACIWDWEFEMRFDFTRAITDRDLTGVVAKTVLGCVLKEGLRLWYSASTVGAICTPGVAHWFLEQQPSQELILRLAHNSKDVVRDVLRPATGNLLDEQDAYRQSFRREEAERQAKEKTELEQAQEVMRTERDPLTLLIAFNLHKPSEWPDISARRKEWLAAMVQDELIAANVRVKIRWLDELTVNIPSAVPVLTALTSHYGLILRDDTPLVHALLGWDARS